MPESRPLKAVALYKPEIQESAFKNKAKKTSAVAKERRNLATNFKN